MFIVYMPEDFTVGETSPCRVNGEPAQVTWRSAGVLVIGADDAREIVDTYVEDGLRCFICSDAGGGEYEVEEFPGEGLIVFSKPKGRLS